MSKLTLFLMFFLATLSAAAFAQEEPRAVPGTLNYVEGSVSVTTNAGLQRVTPRSIGSTVLGAGQFVQTGAGKAEILLTPGVFLRLGANSAVMMVSPDGAHTEVELERGRADVEVDHLSRQSYLLIDQKDGGTQLLKPGLYAFDANKNTMRVFEGEAAVFAGEGSKAGEPVNQKGVTVKAGHELAVNAVLAKPHGFDKDRAAAQDSLYRWGSMRSGYLGEENLNLAESYAGGGGFAPGWTWDSDYYDYTWLPGDGLFWSPFGFGFYSPFYLRGGGFVYGRGGYGGFRGGGFAAGRVGGGFGGGARGGGGGGGHR
jgi:hypothetical protein